IPPAIYPMAFGTPNELNSRCLCAIHYASNLVHGHHAESISDLQHCKYLIAAGRTVGANTGTSHGTARLLDAVERGLKLVVVDPRFSPEASKAYRWIPIRPGTELAFTLAMIHCIFFEIREFDEWFLKNRTNGPYLIGPDGYYAREKSSDKPLVWDILEGRAKTFDDPSVKDYSLFGEYVVDNTTVHPALHLIRERMKGYTPEWAEDLTTVPARIIRDVSREFVEHASIGRTIKIDDYEFPLRPVQFAGSGRGAISQRNGTLFDLSGKIVNLLMGAVEVPGGITGNRNPGPGPYVLEPDEDGIVKPFMEAVGLDFCYPPDHVSMSEFYPHAHATPYIMARAILEPEKYHLPYDFEAILNVGANSIRSGCDREIFIKAFKKLPFLVNLGFNYDEMTMMSDIVFPGHHFLEHEYARFYAVTHQNLDDSVRGLVCAMGRSPAVTPSHNTRSADEVLLEIADRVGFLKGENGINDYMNRSFRLEGNNKLDLDKRYTIEEMIDRRVRQMFGDENDYERLLNQGAMYRFDTQGKHGHNYYYWPENRTRHPIYFERLKKSGDKLRKNLSAHHVRIPAWKDQEECLHFYQAIPFWITPPEMRSSPEYDMYACNWKSSLMRHGTGDTQQNPWLAEIRDEDPYELYIWVNTGTAKRKGLDDGDEVCVESRHGRVKGRIKCTQLIHPEVIGIPGCYGSGTSMMSPEARKGTHYNRLLSGEEETNIDPISGSITISPKVKIYLHTKSSRRS
ncbi:MAG: molybdopterin-dependent oxidoreductase, partial [Deltaproteobacteria bacterium]|nr:molybdopterin-dependent oxidoreductase [Deltaproteobacteria bacterium]